MTTDPSIDDVLAAMTTTQKVGQLNQRLLGWHALRRTSGGFALTEEALAEIERWQGMGALYAPMRADAWSGRSWTNGGIRPEERAEAMAVLQEAVAAASPQGIGVLVAEEAPHGHQALGGTTLPVNLAAGASWDPSALEEASRAVAAELAASGVHLALVSALDVLRDGRWGRSEETFGEDPLLAAELTRAIVRGMQGEDRRALGGDGVGVVLKHLAAQGEAVGGRNGQSALLGPNDLEEIHLPPVIAGLDAGVVGFMAAYNDIDGIPCCAHHGLLTGLLREQHGFDGIVMADMYAVDRLAGMTGDLPSAGRAGLLAGVDLSLCDEGFTTLDQLAESDERVAAQVDRAARRVLALKARMGLLGPQRSTDPGRETVRLETAREAARHASRTLAASSLVLLADGADGAPRSLPLDPAALRRLAVVGPYAEDVPCLLGDYVAPQPAGSALSIADALREALPQARVDAAPWASPTDLAATCLTDGAAPSTEDPATPGVVDLAASDTVVIVLGGTSHRSYDDEFAENGAIAGRAGSATGGEGVDRADISLPGAQDALVRAVRAATPAAVPVIAVVVAGRPHVLTEVLAHSQALVWAGYPGPFGGEAIADLLLGAAEPTGRLPMTLPRHPAVLPLRYNDRHRSASVYQDVPEPVLFDVGHGLRYRDLEVTGVETAVDGQEVRLVATAVTRGDAPTAGTLTVFGHRRGGLRVPRRRELLAFARVQLEPGVEQRVELRLPLERAFADPANPAARTDLDIEGVRCEIAPPGA
ncbi:glycoside hydrolase family 3 N-terminal domain-containing protein [Brachybacterium sp. YJGR34]|uniref:glycoside hydrolase family 3 N-terminal domain-containing protein n=1 Tax=Brachybacterium sp. YJGR34 TaxID=2059911 RepID=UPI000E0C27E6|nr:glycoside hydrolase family 3 N-terminal domain-containing protein [Brachybacterium sp. YJGR34]